MNSPELSVVIPCYNEEKNLALLVQAFSSQKTTVAFELVLVNNGSNDNSDHIIKELLELHSFLTTTTVDVNQGYGYGILTGLKKAQGKHLCWTHADLQTDPSDIFKAYDIILNSKAPDKTFVKGYREERSDSGGWIASIMSFIMSGILKEQLEDINAQPNMFPKSFYNEWEHAPHDVNLEIYAYYLAKRKGFQIERIPVVFADRNSGESKLNRHLGHKIKQAYSAISYALRLRRALRTCY